MISDQVWLAAIVAASTTIGGLFPLAAVALKSRGERKAKQLEAELHVAEKVQDWARLDAVAAAAQTAATAARHAAEGAATTAAETARVLEVNTRIVAESHETTQGQLREIQVQQKATHTLVNSNLTDEMQRGLVSLIEIVKLKEELGHAVSDEARAQITALQNTLEERRKATITADAEAAAKTPA